MNPFGPILRSDLVRIARRQRITLMRTAYAVGLAGIAATTYFVATRSGTIHTRPRDLAPITAALFYSLFALQFIAVIATPNWTADAIAGEKERRTLPFLLMTPLDDWQIVAGKLAARLAQITLFVLAGLPVLCALQFFGGVEPLLVLIGYAVLAVSVLSLGSLAVLCSVYGRNVRAAGQRAGQAVVAYLFVMYAGNLALSRWPMPGVVQEVFDWLDAGNPWFVGRQIAEALRGGWRFADAALPAIGRYILVHLVVAGVFLTWAARKLRPIAALHAEGPPLPDERLRIFRPPTRPPVGNRPVLWKALHFDFRQVRSVGGQAMARVLFVLSFLPVILIVVTTAIEGSWRYLPDLMNVWMVRSLGTVVLCGLMVMIAANSSACLGVERRKKTYDELVLTDLTTEEILGQKWWASIIVIRWALVWVGVHWLIAVVSGGLHPLALPLLTLEWCAYAAFAASLGVYCGTRWPRARKAGIYVGVIGFLAVALPIFLSGLLALATRAPTTSNMAFVLPASASPPVALAITGFYGPELSQMRTQYPAALIYIVIGTSISVFVPALLARRLWRGACRRFVRAVG